MLGNMYLPSNPSSLANATIITSFALIIIITTNYIIILSIFNVVVGFLSCHVPEGVRRNLGKYLHPSQQKL